MAYRFELATLLRFRKSLEHRSWLELQATNRQVQRLETSIARNERLSSLGKGVQAAELEIWGERYYKSTRSELEQSLLHTRQQAAAKLAEFYGARQKRQILENLYLRGKKLYDTERARREQARIDELFLLRRSRSAQN